MSQANIVEIPRELTPENVVLPGVVEALARSGRYSMFMECFAEGNRQMLMYIPPEGTSYGDRVVLEEMGFKFFTYDHKFRGTAKLLTLEFRIGEQLASFLKSSHTQIEQELGRPMQYLPL